MCLLRFPKLPVRVEMSFSEMRLAPSLEPLRTRQGARLLIGAHPARAAIMWSRPWDISPRKGGTTQYFRFRMEAGSRRPAVERAISRMDSLRNQAGRPEQEYPMMERAIFRTSQSARRRTTMDICSAQRTTAQEGLSRRVRRD